MHPPLLKQREVRFYLEVLSWAFGFSLGAADGGWLVSESDGRELRKMFEACPMKDAIVYAAGAINARIDA